MRTLLLTFFLLTFFISSAQIPAINKVYVIEGIVADQGTLKTIPSAILYNDSLRIITATDENGYFKSVLPFDQIKAGIDIPLVIVKEGYKPLETIFNYRPPFDTGHLQAREGLIWPFDIKIVWLAEAGSNQPSSVSSRGPAKLG